MFQKLGARQGSNPRRAMARPGCLLQLCSCSFMFVSLGCQKARTPQQGNHSLRCRPGMSSSSVNRRASHWSNGIAIRAAMLLSAEKYTRFSAQMLEPNQQEFGQGIKLVLVLMLLPPDMICNASSLSRNAASTHGCKIKGLRLHLGLAATLRFSAPKPSLHQLTLKISSEIYAS